MASTDPISLDDIDVLEEWIVEESTLLAKEDVHAWQVVEQAAPTRDDDQKPDIDLDGGNNDGDLEGGHRDVKGSVRNFGAGARDEQETTSF